MIEPTESPEPEPEPTEPTEPEPNEQPFLRLDPGYVPAARLGSAVSLGILFVLGAIGLGIGPGLTESDFEGLFVLRVAAATFWALLFVRAMIWPRLHFARTRYRLTEVALEIRRGVLFRSWNAVPRSRIQHTDVSSGPIQRRFGIATLIVHTAGTSNASIGLSGVSQEVAESPRDELMRGLLEREGDGV